MATLRPSTKPVSPECTQALYAVLRRFTAEKSNYWHRPLLRPCRQRPCQRAPEPRNELPPSHSITSSARASSVGGTSMPGALAVLVFKAITNLTGS
jgi:hypothetical protein